MSGSVTPGCVHGESLALPTLLRATTNQRIVFDPKEPHTMVLIRLPSVVTIKRIARAIRPPMTGLRRVTCRTDISRICSRICMSRLGALRSNAGLRSPNIFRRVRPVRPVARVFEPDQFSLNRCAGQWVV